MNGTTILNGLYNLHLKYNRWTLNMRPIPFICYTLGLLSVYFLNWAIHPSAVMLYVVMPIVSLSATSHIVYLFEVLWIKEKKNKKD